MSNWTDKQRRSWAICQRRLRRNGLLSPERIQKLDSKGFDWRKAEKRARPDPVTKKIKLLEMARSGEQRPSQKSKDPVIAALGQALSSYTGDNGRKSDPIFDKEIREARPDWFEDTIVINKARLLEMALNGEQRPPQKSKDPAIAVLATALSRYTSGSGRKKDPIFDKEIREAAPQWWEDTVAVNKTKLLEMARNGESKPGRDTPLGVVLANYICSVGVSYDQDFDREIKRLAPKWFELTVTINKAKLLEMARNGESKPSHGSKNPVIAALGQSLGRYTRSDSNCYDSKFDSEIRCLVPDWFEDTAAISKAKLRELALSKEPKLPKLRSDTPLGQALRRYTTKRKNGCYDPVFDREIRHLAPHWFKSSNNGEVHDE